MITDSRTDRLRILIYYNAAAYLHSRLHIDSFLNYYFVAAEEAEVMAEKCEVCTDVPMMEAMMSLCSFDLKSS